MNIMRFLVELKKRFRMSREKECGTTPSVDHLVSKGKVKNSTYLQSLVSAGVLEGSQSPIQLDG